MQGFIVINSPPPATALCLSCLPWNHLPGLGEKALLSFLLPLGQDSAIWIFLVMLRMGINMNSGCGGVLFLCLGDRGVFHSLRAGETERPPLEPFSGSAPASHHPTTL